MRQMLTGYGQYWKKRHATVSGNLMHQNRNAVSTALAQAATALVSRGRRAVAPAENICWQTALRGTRARVEEIGGCHAGDFPGCKADEPLCLSSHTNSADKSTKMLQASIRRGNERCWPMHFDEIIGFTEPHPRNSGSSARKSRNSVERTESLATGLLLRVTIPRIFPPKPNSMHQTRRLLAMISSHIAKNSRACKKRNRSIALNNWVYLRSNSR
jgi:hypothetical protein